MFEEFLNLRLELEFNFLSFPETYIGLEQSQ